MAYMHNRIPNVSYEGNWIVFHVLMYKKLYK